MKSEFSETINYSQVFIYSEQPTTCPECGTRTEIILDLSHTMDQTQVHKCLDCELEFVLQSEGNSSAEL